MLCSIFCIVSSNFQIHYLKKKVALSDSKGKVELFPAGGEKISLDVPSEVSKLQNPVSTQGYLWIIGTFNGIDGLDGIDISNTIVSEFNIDDFCGTPQNVKILDVNSMPPKVPAGNRKGRRRQNLHT